MVVERYPGTEKKESGGMNNNVLGLMVSYGYVFGILLLGEGIRKVWQLSQVAEVHPINWELVYPGTAFSQARFSPLFPVTFIVLNYASTGGKF